MRIVLLYAPPRKTDAPAAPPGGGVDTRDEALAPYGLLSLAAQATRAGHEVKVLNLATLAWPRVAELLDALEADVYGLSCFTSNRLGVGAAAERIRRGHAGACIVVGGPHVSALPIETLAHWPAVDVVAVGEGEETFLELLGRIEAGASPAGLAGAAWRDEQGVPRLGPPRERIADLDALAPVHERFAYPMLLTSRGCPGRCTFCASGVLWGRRLSLHSPQAVVDAVEAALASLPFPTIMVKDDTFTANRRRAIAICREMRRRGLNLLWSCDTRADAVDDELFAEMRLAGCQQVSLGVESGSPEVLRRIRKKVTPAKAIEAARMARRAGLRVRFYMIAGHRGETAEDFRMSLELLAAARPHEYVFSILTAFPGTEEFEAFRRAGKLTCETFFERDDLELWSLPPKPIMDELLARHNGRVRTWSAVPSRDCRAVADRFPGLPSAELDLGAALFREGDLDAAEGHLRRAIELDYPIPELATNYLAGIVGRRGDLAGMERMLVASAGREHPHPVVAANARALTAWRAAGGRRGGGKLNLQMHHDFQAITPPVQPVAPGPLPDDVLRWRAGRAAVAV